jgi:hypothetical protein
MSFDDLLAIREAQGIEDAGRHDGVGKPMVAPAGPVVLGSRGGSFGLLD